LGFALIIIPKTTLSDAISKAMLQNYTNKGAIELTGTKISKFPTEDSCLNELASSKEYSRTGETTQVKGKYGKYGGQYVPEILMPALEEL
jgi:hypothetical protein